MVLSWSRGFVFVKGRKVAGTSVECVLGPLCDEDDVVTPITPRDEAVRLAWGGGARNYSTDPAAELAYLRAVASSADAALARVKPPQRDYYHHMSLREVAAKAGSAVLDLQVVCVERHPYAKVLSWANHQVSWRAYERGGEMRSGPDELRAVLRETIASGDVATVRNVDLYRRPSGEVDVRLLRQEHLAEDLAVLLAEHGARLGELPHLKRGLGARPEDLSELLTPAELETIDELFAEELERFGYEPVR